MGDLNNPFSIMGRILALLLLPLVLSAARRIELAQNFIADPNDQSIIHSPFLEEVQRVLAEKEMVLVASDLKDDLKGEDVACVVVWNKPEFLGKRLLRKIPKEKAVLFLWEPPTVQSSLYSPELFRHFKRVYTWDDDLVDNKKFFKFYYPALTPMRTQFPSFAEKKLLTCIASNKGSAHPKQLYGEREAVIRFFEDKAAGEFEFYGRGWKERNYKNYRGAPEEKMDVIQRYKFAICYENMRDVKGYVSEKIFDAFAAGVVPVYWGASNIGDYIPSNCFIDRRRFKDTAELYAFLKGMSEESYNGYIENIRLFLKSDKAHLFSMSLFHVTFLEAIR